MSNPPADEDPDKSFNVSFGGKENIHFSPEFIVLQERQAIFDPRYDDLHRFTGGQSIAVHAKSDNELFCTYVWTIDLWRTDGSLNCRISYETSVPLSARVRSVYCLTQMSQLHAHGINVALYDQSGARLGEIANNSHFGTWLNYDGVRRGEILGFNQELARPIAIRPHQVHSIYVIPVGDVIGVGRNGLI
jgi:hypothetical protein